MPKNTWPMIQARKNLAELTKDQRKLIALLKKAGREGQPAFVILPFGVSQSKEPKEPKEPKIKWWGLRTRTEWLGPEEGTPEYEAIMADRAAAPNIDQWEKDHGWV